MLDAGLARLRGFHRGDAIRNVADKTNVQLLTFLGDREISLAAKS